MLCQDDATASCWARDGGRPSGAALQEEASNCHELLKAAVVNVMVKRRGCDCVMYGSGRRAQANLRGRIERLPDDTRTGDCSGMSMEDTCLLAMRCPVYRRRDPGFRTELEVGDGKGKGTRGDPREYRGAGQARTAP